MNDNENINSKEFSSLEEVQKMPISDEINTNFIDEQEPNNLFKFLLILFTIIFFVALGYFLFKQTIVEKINYDLLFQNEHNKKKENTNLIININGTLVYRKYKMKHLKPINLSLINFKEFLPKNEKNKTISNKNKIFSNKYLNIDNPKINYDYIYTIRKSDFKDNEVRNVSFENETFDFYYYFKNKGLYSLKEFCEICDNKEQNFSEEIKEYKNPLISIIIAVYNAQQNLLRTIKSIQNQSFKELEIIIIEDKEINLSKSCESIIEHDPRIRVFSQKYSLGLWRKRLDGFLYSKGKFILHMDAGDILSDKLVLEDIYNLAVKYDLDSVRFSLLKTNYFSIFNQTRKKKSMIIFPENCTKITYTKPEYDLNIFGYGTIWNRLVRADIISKGLDLVDEIILNTKKNLNEDIWWNKMIDGVSVSNLIVNRLGYIFLNDKNITIQPLINNDFERDKTINEFIYSWYFDLILLPQNDEKKLVIDNLRNFNLTNNTVFRTPINLSYLNKKSNVFVLLMKKLLRDNNVEFLDKIFIKELYDSIKLMLKEKKEAEKEKTEKLENINIKNNNLNSQNQNNLNYNQINKMWNNNQINNFNNNPNKYKVLNQNNQNYNIINNNLNNQQMMNNKAI